MAAAPLVPCAQNPPASSIGSPDIPAGTTDAPWARKPVLAKPSPARAPPKAGSDCGMGGGAVLGQPEPGLQVGAR